MDATGCRVSSVKSKDHNLATFLFLKHNPDLPVKELFLSKYS